ncbi:capsular biosynthesis protein [Glaciimonas sp. CA11.2]|uniref:capsular biosynthesis protein n=1 Tax=Glaciimonas sp. CA11.2 TaxID=3048601 RepID=UPI002AB4C935|nr:capsular biosynthesis protein [Glaciimonas sp. CA11.2]MDY7545041.1 capsular biosynthesis protein [Glaciimonas sp. CA11.2]MEB0163699.1 capsular biosynthesis protein [Glaciimonas sp. CA11.2]
MIKVLLYDNSSFVSQDIGNLLGVSRFSDIYYRKRSLDRWVADICRAAGIQFIEIGGDSSGREAVRQLGILGTRNLVVLYLPAFVAFGCVEEDASIFLKKLSLTRSSLAVFSNEAETSMGQMRAAATVGELARSLLQAAATGENINDLISAALDQMHPIKGDVDMIDMRDPLHFTDYLTSNFDARFFNSVQTVDDFVLIKRSSEVEKLRREFKYYSLLSPVLQMFFIQPYDFKLENGSASYKMERLFVPDMALQWIHGSLDELSMKRFLDKVFYYLSLRPNRQVGADEAQTVHEETYRGKVQTRLRQLKEQPEYQKLKPYLDANFGGVDILLERYLRLLTKVGGRALGRDLCIGHGDLCFSNILYSKTTGLMRFIDPRGADGDADLYVSPFYDLAKLSHSIAGSYDFINYGLYRMEINADLQIDLQIDPGPPAWAREMFDARLLDAGFNPAMVRVFEVSLFLSMVPLHIDAPKKVLAFLVNANTILTELELII